MFLDRYSYETIDQPISGGTTDRSCAVDLEYDIESRRRVEGRSAVGCRDPTIVRGHWTSPVCVWLPLPLSFPLPPLLSPCPSLSPTISFSSLICYFLLFDLVPPFGFSLRCPLRWLLFVLARVPCNSPYTHLILPPSPALSPCPFRALTRLVSSCRRI